MLSIEIISDINKLFSDQRKQYLNKWNGLIQREQKTLKEMYQNNILNSLNVKNKNWVRGGVKSKIFNADKDRPHQLNIYAKGKHKFISGHYDQLISRAKGKKMIIKLSSVNLTRKEFHKLIQRARNSKALFTQKDVLYVLINKETRSLIRKVVRGVMPQEIKQLEKKEFSKAVRKEMKRLSTTPIPVGVFKSEVRRPNRLKIDQLKNKMTHHLLNKLKG